MADLQETVGTVIRRERYLRQLTMKELAERSSISLVYLGEIERGKKYPSSVVIERLAEALDMEVYDLLQLIAEDLRAEAQPVERVIGFTGHRVATPESRVVVREMPRVVNMLEPVRLVKPAEPQLPTITVLRDLCMSVA